MYCAIKYIHLEYFLNTFYVFERFMFSDFPVLHIFFFPVFVCSEGYYYDNKIYYKKDDFSFPIVDFLLLFSYILSVPAYSYLIYMLCTSYHFVIKMWNLIVNRL